MDQFRGYTVVGMFFVNFLEHFAHAPDFLKHHNTYFSFADSIMPQFLFAVGFSSRLTLMRGIARRGRWPTYWSAIKRNLGLILLSIALVGLASPPRIWSAFTTARIQEKIAQSLKSDCWETLAIIGVTSLFVLPVMGSRPIARVIYLLVALGLHALASHEFYFHFVFAQPNSFNQYWGAARVMALDGGPLGCLTWSLPMLAGSLVYDVIARFSVARAAILLGVAAGFTMLAGYAMSTLGSLYEGLPAKHRRDGYALTPVTPPATDAPWSGRWRAIEAPLTPGVSPDIRPLNYWTMSKRAATLSFMTFATGFSLLVYFLWVVVSDLWGFELGVFRAFGQNPLIAYVWHGMVIQALRPVLPSDAPSWYVWLFFAFFAALTYSLVRRLEKESIFVRL